MVHTFDHLSIGTCELFMSFFLILAIYSPNDIEKCLVVHWQHTVCMLDQNVQG